MPHTLATMATFSFALLLLLRLSIFTSALANTYSIYEKLVVHEKRQEHWADTRLAKRRIDEDAILPMRIGLMQNENAQANAERWLTDVSHPASKDYGRYWTQAEVVNAFQPSMETIQNITAWLYHHEIYDFTHSDNKLWFAFDIPASKAEQSKWRRRTIPCEFGADFTYSAANPIF